MYISSFYDAVVKIVAFSLLLKWVSQNCNFKIDLNLPSYRSFQIYWISSAFEIFFRTHHNFRKQQLWCSFLWSGNTFVSCETLSQLGDICFCGYFSWLDNLYLLRVNFDPMGASAAPACSPRQWCPIEREAHTLIYLIIFKWHNLKLDDDLCYCDHCNCQTNRGRIIKPVTIFAPKMKTIKLRVDTTGRL